MTCKCTICYEEIKTKEFDAVQDFDCVDFDDPTCLRLKCGHAYHTNCIMQAFRSNLKCPVCRTDLVEVKNHEENFIQLFANEESDDDDDIDNLLIQTTLNRERAKNKELKECRKKLKETVKDFHIFHTDLTKRRKAKIRECLKTFRKEEHKNFRMKIHGVEKVLKVVKKNEQKIVDEKLLNTGQITHDDTRKYFLNFNHLYSPYDVLQRNGGDINLNGFMRRFWGV